MSRSSLSAEQCRARAIELRVLADTYFAEQRAEMMHIADSYDRMAEDREIRDRMNARLDVSRRETEESAIKC